ncbi:MAG: hypothetical protein FD175_1176 [Beijerinckiaceae bacterium]|nr:MAG: hypothetical protein FD175_1176 [Beijerinckiaceae bacterium]
MGFLARLHEKIFKYKEGISFYSQSIAAVLLSTMSIIVSVVAIYVSSQQMIIANNAYELEVAKTSPYFKIEKSIYKDDFYGEIELKMENVTGLSGLSSVKIETIAGVLINRKFCFWRAFRNFYEYEMANVEKSKEIIGVYDRSKSVNIKYITFRKENFNAFALQDMKEKITTQSFEFFDEISKWVEMNHKKEKNDFEFIVENTYLNVEYYDQFGRKSEKYFSVISDKILLETSENNTRSVENNYENKRIGAVVLRAGGYKLAASPTCQDAQIQ